MRYFKNRIIIRAVCKLLIYKAYVLNVEFCPFNYCPDSRLQQSGNNFAEVNFNKKRPLENVRNL
jgi:hypothetical protein